MCPNQLIYTSKWINVSSLVRLRLSIVLTCCWFSASALFFLFYLILLTMFVVLADKQAAEYRIKQQMVCASQSASSRVKCYFSAFPLYSCPSMDVDAHTHPHKHTHKQADTQKIWGMRTARQAKNSPLVLFIFTPLLSSTAESWVPHLSSCKNVVFECFN